MDGGETGALYPTVVSLVLVLGAAAAAAVFLRRWKGSIGRSAGPMQLRHVIALGPRERLALVKVGSRFLVVGVTAAGISAVAEFTDDSLDAPEAAQSSEAVVREEPVRP
jgi:flagellar biosynthetic protein FliO